MQTRHKRWADHHHLQDKPHECHEGLCILRGTREKGGGRHGLVANANASGISAWDSLPGAKSRASTVSGQQCKDGLSIKDDHEMEISKWRSTVRDWLLASHQALSLT